MENRDRPLTFLQKLLKKANPRGPIALDLTGFSPEGKASASQASLDQVLPLADRVVVRDLMWMNRPEPTAADGKTQGVADDPIVFETTDPATIEELSTYLRIKDGDTGHCMCLGDAHILFFRDDQQIARIGLHHGQTIRWDDKWSWDAELVDGIGLLEWLDRHGYPDPLIDYREDEVT